MLGVYGLSDAQARRKCEEYKRQIKAGDDPRPAEKARTLDTFAEVRQRFLTAHVDRNLAPKTQYEYRSVLNRPIFKPWESRPIKSITRGDVIKLILAAFALPTAWKLLEK